jgi:hypothetical protein
MEYINIDILDKVIDKEFWIKEPSHSYYSHHLYRYFPIETCNDCGNCDGANCEHCKLIEKPERYVCSIEADKLVDIIKEKIIEFDKSLRENEAMNIAAELAFCDGSFIPATYYRIIWPTEQHLKERYPDFYKELIC